jgi:hypothetical protein
MGGGGGWASKKRLAQPAVLNINLMSDHQHDLSRSQDKIY